MESYAEGNELAFERLYELMSPRLYRFCLRLAHHRSDADDLLQETFLRLHRARNTFTPGANPLYWAFAIARSAFLTGRRYRRSRPEDLGAADDASSHQRLRTGDGQTPEGEARARDLLDLVRFEVARMSEKNRLAFILMKEEGLSVDEAAAVMGT